MNAALSRRLRCKGVATNLAVFIIIGLAAAHELSAGNTSRDLYQSAPAQGGSSVSEAALKGVAVPVDQGRIQAALTNMDKVRVLERVFGLSSYNGETGLLVKDTDVAGEISVTALSETGSANALLTDITFLPRASRSAGLGVRHKHIRAMDRTWMTGMLVGDAGSTFVYGYRLDVTIVVEGEEYTTSTFHVMEENSQRQEVDKAARAREEAMDRGINDALSANQRAHVENLFPGLSHDGPSTYGFGQPPSCGSCGSTWNSDIFWCDFVATGCVVSASGLFATSIVTCGAFTGAAASVCIAGARAAYLGGLTACAGYHHNCFKEANADLDNCMNICDGGVGQLP